jgi:hypothetical protein
VQSAVISTFPRFHGMVHFFECYSVIVFQLSFAGSTVVIIQHSNLVLTCAVDVVMFKIGSSWDHTVRYPGYILFVIWYLVFGPGWRSCCWLVYALRCLRACEYVRMLATYVRTYIAYTYDTYDTYIRYIRTYVHTYIHTCIHTARICRTP